MNGPLKMYLTRQIVHHDIKPPLPDCMYKLKNIHSSRNGVIEQRSDVPSKKVDIFDQVKQFLKNNQTIPEMAALELRQEEILQQLAELKKQMDCIRSNLKVANPTPTSKITTKTKQAPAPSIPDLIINASPTNPPYSLELLQKLYKDQIYFFVKTHVHCSIITLNESAKQLTQTLEQFIANENVPKVNIRLIWKEVGPTASLIVSYRPILGEANILRYLGRVGNFLNYENLDNVNEIDSLLDVSHKIVIAKTKTERASLMQILNKNLGKSQWLGGADISVADLAAYSAIKQVTNPSEVNVNLSKWLQRCAAC